MQAGRLRHRITIQSKGVTRDEFGAEVVTWGTFWECWASVEPLLGREFLESAQTQAGVTHRITIRQRDGVLPQMRVLFGTRAFDVEAVLTKEERAILTVLMCREEVTV